MDEEFVRSDRKPPGRRIWRLSPGTGVASALLVFLDGELYLERVLAEEVLRTLGEEDRIPPVESIFVSSDGPAARHSDFVCDEGYARFLVEDLLPHVRRSSSEPGAGRPVLVGLSLSGLAAAHAAVTTGEFGAAVCQSPSFWWSRERFASTVPGAGPGPARLRVSVGDGETETGVTHPPSGMLQETSQIDACARGADALRSAGYPVSYRVFPGGHDPECWRDDLALALPWAMAT